jgi:hypothetical protein
MTSPWNSCRREASARGSQPDWPRMPLLGLPPIRKENLLGFARIELPIGLRINNVPLFAIRDDLFALMLNPAFGGKQRIRPQCSGVLEGTIADWLTHSAKLGLRSSPNLLGCKES